jgi:hypothetical protein
MKEKAPVLVTHDIVNHKIDTLSNPEARLRNRKEESMMMVTANKRNEISSKQREMTRKQMNDRMNVDYCQSLLLLCQMGTMNDGEERSADVLFERMPMKRSKIAIFYRYSHCGFCVL